MKTLIELIYAILMVVTWLAGIVLAKGKLSVIAAILFPPYSWYLVVERAMIASGLV